MTETQETPAIRADGGGAGGEVLDETGPGADRAVSRNGAEPSHHARRPMNAFLIFCKRHRSVVRDKYPNLENRSITKILGEWWANLDKDEKACYTGLAKQYKDAFFTAHPNFKWYKLPAPPLRTFATRPGNIGGPSAEREIYIENELCEIKVEQTNNNHLTKVNYNAQPSTSTSKDSHDGKKQMFTPGKLADEAQMGGLSSLIVSNNKHCEEDYANERNFTPQSPTTGFNMPHLETPKFKSSTSNITPNPPKKRPVSESDDPANRNNFYRSEDVSPPSRNLSSAEESKIQKLQDALSETSRMLELSFDSSYESEKCEDKSTLNILDCSKTLSQLTNTKVSDFPQNVSTPGFREMAFKHRGSMSSDESQDKECQQLDDLHLFDKNKGNWNSYLEHAQSKVSGRACKGKRYQEFMAFGGLIVNKRQKKDHMERKSSHTDSQNKLSYEVNSPTCSWKIYENYPKDIASRTEVNENESDLTYCERVDLSESAYKFKKEDDTGQIIYHFNENTAEHAETADSQGNKMFTADDFDLDAKIMALPSLSLEKFQQRKKENKKRKKNLSSSKSKDARPRMPSAIQHYPPESAVGTSCSRPAGSNASFGTKPILLDKDAQSKRDIHQNIGIDERMFLAEQRKSAIIGSKKRKPRKFSITRIDVNNSSTCKDKMEPAKNTCTNIYNPDLKPTSSNCLMPDQNTNENVDLCGLATLAEVAANTSKINEHI